MEAGRGHIRMVTLAPELEGAIDTIRMLSHHGCVAAIGHTDASHETVLAALGAGARVGTHLFNAMRPLHHRDPGPVLALVQDQEVVVELVADGVHMHLELLRWLFDTLGPGRIALVTDAMAAAGNEDGTYALGTQAVSVSHGAARLVDGGALAGAPSRRAQPCVAWSMRVFPSWMQYRRSLPRLPLWSASRMLGRSPSVATQI